MSGQYDVVNATATETWLNIVFPGIYNHEVHLKFLNDNFTIKQSVESEAYETSPWEAPSNRHINSNWKLGENMNADNFKASYSNGCFYEKII